MARNFKRDYINRILNMEVPNGYKFDLANYLHNPHLNYEYPSFNKVIEEDESSITERRVYYFKYYNGTGEYREMIYKVNKSKDAWNVIRTISEKTLEESNRFNIKKLIGFC